MVWELEWCMCSVYTLLGHIGELDWRCKGICLGPQLLE